MAFKNFIQGLESLGYSPSWIYSDLDGEQYCNVVNASGGWIGSSIEDLSDTEILTLDGFIFLGDVAGHLSIQNTHRRWTKGLMPLIKKPCELVVQPIDRLISGLVVLKAYAPDANPEACTFNGRSIMIQSERLDSVSAADRSRLDELGWSANGDHAWEF